MPTIRDPNAMRRDAMPIAIEVCSKKFAFDDSDSDVDVDVEFGDSASGRAEATLGRAFLVEFQSCRDTIR